MIKLLIADDEEMIRSGIENSIDWSKFDVQCIGTVSDGGEAYDKIKELRPEIVITDIKMPVMSGLELIRKVKEENIDVCFIILSAYANFEYAKEAMRYGVMYYLLKPVGVFELEEVVDDICKNLKCTNEDSNCNVGEKSIFEDKYKEAMEIAFKYIDEHIYDQSLSLGFVARDVVYMSADYFGRVFKTITGKFFTQYVMDRRIDKAKELFENEDLMIYEVALRVGFKNNSTYFAQVFKRYTGKTPKEYRNMWKKN